MEINKICIFCGSSMGTQEIYGRTAARLATLMLKKNIDLVYGGSNVGLMHILAETILKGGGKVYGIMPRSLVAREVAHLGLTKLHIVDTMQERKLMMAEMSDAFITLPGGFGTLDELAEMLTFNQLRIHDKPLGILNTAAYFDHLLTFMDHSVQQGFVRPEHRNSLIIDEDPEALIQKLYSYRPVGMDKWIRDIKIESGNAEVS